MSALYDHATAHPGGYRDVTPVALANASDSVRIVDVREPAEFTGELGHVQGAELVPLGTLEDAAKAWDHDQEIVLICRSGARSGRAASLLTSLGFRRTMNMVGGMVQWNDARLPLAT